MSGAVISRGAPAARRRLDVARLVRAMPIGWRVGSFAVINTVVVIVMASMIWSSARMLGTARDDLRRLRESDTLLTLLASEAGRLQNLIYQYIGEQRPETFAEILLLREAVLGTLKTPRRNRGGTGLGLHVIFNLVTQSLGGRLTLDSEPARGTAFRITLPRHAIAAAATTD